MFSLLKNSVVENIFWGCSIFWTLRSTSNHDKNVVKNSCLKHFFFNFFLKKMFLIKVSARSTSKTSSKLLLTMQSSNWWNYTFYVYIFSYLFYLWENQNFPVIIFENFPKNHIWEQSNDQDATLSTLNFKNNIVH